MKQQTPLGSQGMGGYEPALAPGQKHLPAKANLPGRQSSVPPADQPEPLPLNITKNGFELEQVIRCGWKALYRKKLNGVVVSYELFYVHVQHAVEVNGISFKFKERYPSDEAFGRSAWSIIRKSEGEAIARYTNLKMSNSKTLNLSYHD